MSIRHSIIWTVLRPLVAIFLRIKFGYRAQMASGLPENYIVLSNHTTDYDPLLVGVSFRKQMYFVASGHIARWKIAYPLLKFAFAPILRKKGMSAAHAIIDILRKLKKGANVCMFAEGVRTWDGVTSPIAPTTGQLVKRAGCALVTYKIVGGYFLSPGWCDGTRRGEAFGRVVNVYTKEQLSEMTDAEINELIARDLYEDAYARQLESPKPYKGKNFAEKLENLLFICPSCRSHETIRSSGNCAKCEACGCEIVLDEYGMLNGISQKTVRELSEWQKECVMRDAEDGASYTVSSAVLYDAGGDENVELASGEASLGPDGFSMSGINIPLDKIDSMAYHGRRTVVFSSGKSYYELKPEDGQNAIKFVLLYQSYQNINKCSRV